jgi:hypothetical protein
VMRQSEAVRPPGLGGKGSRELATAVLGQKGQDELGMQPGAGKLGAPGRKLAQAQKRFQALEGELHLPAQAIEGQHAQGWEALGGQAGQEENEACGQKRARAGVRPRFLAS